MAGRGGKTPGAGRKPGVPNKATAEIKELARQYGPKAIEELAIMAGLLQVADRKPAENDTARMAAAKEILDRGYGKAAQAITGEGGEGPVLIKELLATVNGRTRGIPGGS
jgi:hypothetical protein